MHISLDGFVAGLNGKWTGLKLMKKFLIMSVSGLAKATPRLYGRVTYQMMENYWPIAGDEPTATKHDIEHSKWYNKFTKLFYQKQ